MVDKIDPPCIYYATLKLKGLKNIKMSLESYVLRHFSQKTVNYVQFVLVGSGDRCLRSWSRNVRIVFCVCNLRC